MSAPPTLEKASARPRPRWDSGRPRLAMALSAGVHSLALMGFFVYHVFPPKRPSIVPVFEMVSLEPPKLRPLKPRSPEPPPPEKTEARKPKPTVPIVKPEPKAVKEEDTTKPVQEIPEESAELTTTIVSNVPADPRLAFWASRVKKRVESLWNPPAGIEIQGTAKTVLSFQVARDGTVAEIVVSQGSGNSMLDELAERTIQRLERVPPIPENFPEDLLQVSYEFVYNGQ